MSEEHIPAWKRIIAKKSEDSETIDLSIEDPLNVTTHLASGSLTKKEKKLIINSDAGLKKTKKKINKSTKREKKRDKLSKEENQKKKSKVLKDQLRYLIEFYQTKVDKKLPKELYQLESVGSNYDEEKDAASEDITGIIEVWKFSKQKQNWLLKNLFNVEEIPIQYNSLLLSYFRDIQGKSRQDLLEKCRANINQWNAYATEQEEKIKAVIEGTAENDETESNEETKQEDNNGENQDEKAIEEKKEELPMPNKDKVQRSYFLLQNIVKRDDNSEFANLQLKNFD